jgi:hypothetical protein
MVRSSSFVYIGLPVWGLITFAFGTIVGFALPAVDFKIQTLVESVGAADNAG